MSERQKLIHLHSAEVKVPSKEILEYGEIAVQYNSGSTVLYTKKSDDVITKFVDETSVDNKIKVEQLRAEGIENSILEKIESLSGTNHTHANKELLDTYTQTEENLADAVAKKHAHENAEVLNGINAEKVAAWDAAEQNAKDYADGLAKNYDAAGAAATAEQNANAYADGLAKNYDAAGAAAQALVDANAYADGLASNYDEAGAAAQALTDAKAYTDSAITELNLSETYAAKEVEGTIATLVGEDKDKSVREISSEEVAKIVNSADTKYDTLKEIADWILNDTTGAAQMANDIEGLKAISADTRLDALEEVKHAHENSTVLNGITAEKVTAWDAAEQNAKDYATSAATSALTDAKAYTEEVSGLTLTAAKNYADGLASNYDAAGAAATAEQNAKDYADGLAVNYDAAGAAATAEQNANAYADGLAKNYDAAGAAATAEQNAKDYADGLAVNYDAAGAAATAETNANNYTNTQIASLVIDCGVY